jgi:hypothetical protein
MQAFSRNQISVQVSAEPLAAEADRLIESETKKGMNVEHRTSNHAKA